MYNATKEFRFEMAHVLTNYNGLCGNLHGHSYKCLVTISSDSLDDGMVMDFSNIKKIINEKVLGPMDHACAFNSNSDDEFENELYLLCRKHGKRMIVFPFRTTAENMSKWIYDRINDEIGNLLIQCTKVELYETTTGHATYEE